MNIIAVASAKGGVGKSTLINNLTNATNENKITTSSIPNTTIDFIKTNIIYALEREDLHGPLAKFIIETAEQLKNQ